MPLANGQIFAGYRILRRLGSGGMGEVYLAQHPRLPRQDALKVLAADVSADADYRARFNREADLASTLWHPHIVGVHDRGEEEGQLWISMDFVDGLDAARLLADRYPAGMPVEEVARIVTAVASALDYAHKQGLLHRDVKPANIMMTHLDDEGEQRILLTDFGIARNVNDISGLTKTNMTVGTVAYCAPEQLLGEDVDGRTDQYSLAATAYHLLTGFQLFPNSNPAVVISRHLNVQPPLLADVRPELAKLDPVFAKGLAKPPEDRFARCSDFARALSELINSADAPTQAAPTSSKPAPKARQDPTSNRTRQGGSAHQDRSGRTGGGLSRTQRQDQVRGLDGLQGIQDPGPHRHRFHRTSRYAGPAILAIVLVATAAFATIETVRTNRLASRTFPAWQPYVDAAKTTAINLTTINYQTVDNDIQRILDNSTGAFHDDFQKRSQPFGDTVKQAQSASSGTVKGAGLESLDGTQARVLVVVHVKTSNAGKPDQERSWRMRISVDMIGQSYKASNVEFVP